MLRFPLYFLLSFCFVRARSYQPKQHSLAHPDPAASEEVPAIAEDPQALLVSCEENSIEIRMRPHLLDPAELIGMRLGPPGPGRDGCAARRSAYGELVIGAPLAECGSRVMVTDGAVLYSNVLLLFFPGSKPGEALQMQGAAVPVLCRYKRRYAVSSGALRPTWTSLISVHSAHLSLDFSLSLMADDWSSVRNSPVYFMSEMVKIRASVDHHHPYHPPLRLYAGSCVATLTPDVESQPRYSFIDDQGCFTDSQLSGSSSRFLPRVWDDLLHIQLEPFLFHQDHRHSIYITCYLQAVPISKKEPEKKACSFITGRWRSADGDDHACESCDRAAETAESSSAGFIQERVKGSKKEHRLNELHRETTLGPLIFLQEGDYDSGT